MGPDTTPGQSTPRNQKKRQGLRSWGLVVLAVICAISFINNSIDLADVLLHGPDSTEIPPTRSLWRAIEGLAVLFSAVIMWGEAIFEIRDARRNPFDAPKTKPVLNVGIVALLLLIGIEHLLPFVIEVDQYIKASFDFLAGGAGLLIAWSFLTEFDDSIWRHRRKHKPKRKNRPHALP